MLINGEARNSVSGADRGLHYGDGLFETMAIRMGIPQFWDRHWRRLDHGCERLGIVGVDRENLRKEACGVSSDVEQGVLKVIITRGEGGRGYRPPQSAPATRIVAAYPWPDYPMAYAEEGVVARICAVRLGRNPALAGLKHLNRLEQILARREWDDPRVAEGLMLDNRGYVISGTMSNVFMVKDGQLMTPLLNECGVAGVMRGILLELAEEAGISWCETDLSPRDISFADEVFLSNSLIGIWPVRSIERQVYVIGPVQRLLAERLASLRHSAWE